MICINNLFRMLLKSSKVKTTKLLAITDIIDVA